MAVCLGCGTSAAARYADRWCDFCGERNERQALKPWSTCSVCERFRCEGFRIELVNEGRALHFCESHALAAEALASVGIGGVDAVQILKRLSREGA